MREQHVPAGLAMQYHKILAEEGFRPHIDDDGDVVFKFESKSYFIDICEDDPQTFSVVLTYFWSIDDQDELTRALRAANEVNAIVKATKVFVWQDANTMARVDLFVESTEQAKAAFPRVLSILQLAMQTFREKMLESAEASETPFDFGGQFGDMGRDC